MKRAAVFVFYNKNGSVDKSVDFYLARLSPLVSRLLIVVNGTLSDEGRRLFSRYTDEIILRENTGYDISAFQAGIRAIGFDALKDFDELVLANDSVFGPVYPLNEMFSVMESRSELSFWGVTGHRGTKERRLTGSPCGYMEAHVQSYFTVYCNSVLRDPCFAEYWDNLPVFESRQQAINRHETYATYYFAQRGFCWDCYVPLVERVESEDMLHAETVKALKEYRCPFIKKNLFVPGLASYPPISEICRFVDENTDYDVSIILRVSFDKLSVEQAAGALEYLCLPRTVEMKLAKRICVGRKRIRSLAKRSKLIRKIWYSFHSS